MAVTASWHRHRAGSSHRSHRQITTLFDCDGCQTGTRKQQSSLFWMAVLPEFCWVCRITGLSRSCALCRESSTTQNEAKNSDRTGGTFLCPRQRDSVVESTSGIRTAANWFRKRKRGESRTHLPCKLGIGWPTWSRPRQFSANPRKRPPPTRAGATPTREDKRKDDNASCSEDSRKQTIQTDAVYSGLHGWCEVCSSQFYACVRKSAVGLRCHEAALNGDGLAQPIGNQLQRLRRQAVRRRNGMIQRASHVWQNRLKWYRPCGGRRAVNCLQVVYGGMRSCQEPDMVVVLVRERRPTNASCPHRKPEHLLRFGQGVQSPTQGSMPIASPFSEEMLFGPECLLRRGTKKRCWRMEIPRKAESLHAQQG